MELLETKERFIELRAKGWSFDKIAKELGKARQTLIDWSKEMQEEIANRKALELEALYENYYLLKEARVKKFGAILAKINTELEGRDFSDVPTGKLLELQLLYIDRLSREVIEPHFKSTGEIKDELDARELLDDLTLPAGEAEVRRLKVG